MRLSWIGAPREPRGLRSEYHRCDQKAAEKVKKVLVWQRHVALSLSQIGALYKLVH